MSGRVVRLAAVVVAMTVAAGCETTDAEPTAADFRTEAEGRCAETSTRLDQLPTPPDQIAQDVWAGEVARALRDEAAELDFLAAPAELQADRRALVLNTEQQAEAWNALAEALALDDAERISTLTTEIAELTLGRDELATEMGLDACRRDR